MSTRSLDAFIALAGAVLLSLGLVGSAVAQQDVSPSPAPSLVPAAEHEAVDALYTEAASDGTGVVRTDLGVAAPGSAPGEELGLWHYLIPAQTALAPHTHPGWQLARVTAGELEYTVLEGEGTLLRADGSEEPMGPGTYVLATGDGVIENPDLVHLGANRTEEPVTIISATLFEAGEPVSTLADEDPAEAAVG